RAAVRCTPPLPGPLRSRPRLASAARRRSCRPPRGRRAPSPPRRRRADPSPGVPGAPPHAPTIARPRNLFVSTNRRDAAEADGEALRACRLLVARLGQPPLVQRRATQAWPSSRRRASSEHVGPERAPGSLPSPVLLRGQSAALPVGHMPFGMLPPRALHPGPRLRQQVLATLEPLHVVRLAVAAGASGTVAAGLATRRGRLAGATTPTG